MLQMANFVAKGQGVRPTTPFVRILGDKYENGLEDSKKPTNFNSLLRDMATE